MSDMVAEVLFGEYEGARVIVIGEDKDVWDGNRWYDMEGNASACHYSYRMGELLADKGFNAYDGKTYACKYKGKSVLFHEDQLDIIREASKEDIRKDLEAGDDTDTDRIIINGDKL